MRRLLLLAANESEGGCCLFGGCGGGCFSGCGGGCFHGCGGCYHGCGGCGYRSCCYASCCYTPCCPPPGPYCWYYPCYYPAGSLYSPYGYGGYAVIDGVHAMAAPAKATVVVSLPADAKLTANGQLTKTLSAKRVFATPELEAGKTYSYTFKMELVKDGQTIEQTQKVVVRAGEETKVNFELPVATASK